MGFDAAIRPEGPDSCVEAHGEPFAGDERKRQAFLKEPAEPARRLRCELDAEHGSGNLARCPELEL